VDESDVSDKEKLLNALQNQIPKTWSTVRVDAFTHHYALEYISKNKPRLLYISYGETDDFAHDGRYDQYLKSAHQTDLFIEELWELVRNDPYYAGNTSLLITTDHGRGTIPKDTWKGHGTSIEGADEIWIAAIGPGIKQLGESKTKQKFYQDQVAATVAALLDLNYKNKRETGAVLEEIIK
jgi:bisphosphoglycerate-independent phosphoglycerate mutase (AlkP superfamily)